MTSETQVECVSRFSNQNGSLNFFFFFRAPGSVATGWQTEPLSMALRETLGQALDRPPEPSRLVRRLRCGSAETLRNRCTSQRTS